MPATVAHYAGGERPDATATAAIASLTQRSNLISQIMGQALAGIWTDLPPADNDVTITLGAR